MWALIATKPTLPPFPSIIDPKRSGNFQPYFMFIYKFDSQGFEKGEQACILFFDHSFHRSPDDPVSISALARFQVTGTPSEFDPKMELLILSIVNYLSFVKLQHLRFNFINFISYKPNLLTI